MATISPYLNFNGNAEQAFLFYKSVFGGDFSVFQRFSDTEVGKNLSPEEARKIMHIALPIGKDYYLYATDFLESLGHKLILGNNFSITIGTESREEADELFAKLSDGGKIEMPIADMFWGSYFGIVIDKFDIQWMVNYENTKKNEI
jgi:PhnB protein